MCALVYVQQVSREPESHLYSSDVRYIKPQWQRSSAAAGTIIRYKVATLPLSIICALPFCQKMDFLVCCLLPVCCVMPATEK